MSPQSNDPPPFLQAFRLWVRNHENHLAQLGWKVELLIQTDIEQSFARLDLESEFRLARITVWESGQSELDVLEISSGRTESWAYLQCPSPDDAISLWQQWLADSLSR